MKIALIHTRLLYRGGLETRMFSYMDRLKAQGHSVTVIVGKVGKGVKVPEGIRLIRLKVRWAPKVFRAWVFDRYLDRLLKKEPFDFVLSMGRTTHHSAVLLPGNHLGYMRAMGKKRKSLSDRMQILMDRKAYAAPGTILACSQKMVEEVVELYDADPLKINVLYPPINAERFHDGHRKRREELREKYSLTTDKQSFIFISASHERKGLPLLLKVFEALQEENFELIVAGHEPVPGNLPNVKHLGFVKETEELYAAGDYFVLPALYEPFGQVVAEALMCGMPVLVSHEVGANEIVTEKEGRVIASFDQEEWIQAIREVSQQQFEIDPEIGSRLGITLEEHVRRLVELSDRQLE